MNSHLSPEQICKWLAGDHGYEEQRHLDACPACHAELDHFQNALTGFRGSLEQSPVPPIRYLRMRQTLARWILATAALALLAAMPVYWNVRQQHAAEQAKADELLLERINASLSRSVPASMEPLMRLISEENQ